MSEICLSARVWRPVILRGMLWVIIAMGTVFMDKTDGLTLEKLAEWTGVDWARLAVAMTWQERSP